MPAARSRPTFHVTPAEDGCTVRLPAGAALSEAAVAALALRLPDLLPAGGQAVLTLDLAVVPALSSGALGQLLGLHRALRAAGGRLALVNPTPAVGRVLRVTRLDTVLEVRSAEPARV